MDRELEEKSKSRDLDTIEDGEEGDDNDNVYLQGDNREVAENAHVLRNLVKSLEASAGEAGPVPNMLKGMDTT